MTKSVTYKFAQVFNYDPICNEIIETRSIKRYNKENLDDEHEDVQILKARAKRYNMLDVPKSINTELKKGGMISFNIDVTREQAEVFMQSSFDLFKFNVDTENKKVKSVIFI